MAAKKNNAAVLAISIASLLIGAFLMYLYMTYNVEKPEENNSITNDYATVMSDNGLLIFIGAEPVNKSYQVIETVEMDDLFEIAQSGQNETGKGKVWKKIFRIGVNAFQNISFRERVNKFSSETRNAYRDADGIIFSQNFKMASVIKFTL
jgi:hypothetical protein